MNTSMEVESAINTYLRRSSETFDLGKNYEVCEIYHSVISATCSKISINIMDINVVHFICYHFRRCVCNYGQHYMITQA